MCPNCDTAGKRLRSTLFLFCFWREKQKTKSAAVKRFAIWTFVAAFCFANAHRSRDFQSPTRGSLSGQVVKHGRLMIAATWDPFQLHGIYIWEHNNLF